MKVIVKDELRARLTCAAYNGSVIAKDILAEIKRNKDVSEVIRGKANHFATKRKRQSGGEGFSKIKIVFTYCNKDITNDNFPDKNNPQAPWFNENRTEVEVSTFVDCFKNLPEYEDVDLEYFANAICVMSKVSVKLYDKMSDFEDAYRQENYTPVAQFGDSTLHNSCMRYEATARNAADFYYHFAGAKIIIAKDGEGNILGRAIVWPKTFHSQEGAMYECSFLDRVYFSHSFVMKLIYNYAESSGINLRKLHNDYHSTASFVVINAPEGYPLANGEEMEEIQMAVKVPASKWHKVGAPYLDTLSYIILKQDGELTLTNYDTIRVIATCRSTGGLASPMRHYCPRCGKLHKESDVVCNTCRTELFQDTYLGRAITERIVMYKGQKVPASFLHKGRPTPTYALYLQIQKLYS